LSKNHRRTAAFSAFDGSCGGRKSRKFPVISLFNRLNSVSCPCRTPTTGSIRRRARQKCEELIEHEPKRAFKSAGSARAAGAPLPLMTRRISSPRRLTVIGKRSAMIRSLAFAASRDVVLGIGTSSDRRMPVSLRPTPSTSPTARRTSARCAPCTAPSRARLSTAAILLGNPGHGEQS
jgi:hypothetical protein